MKIVKTDATTGKTIPQAGVEFKVKNTDTGVWVEQEILYPTPTVLSSYFTNAEGWLVMPAMELIARSTTSTPASAASRQAAT